LTGSIARLGSQYVIGLSATACSNGDLLAMEQTEAANKEEVLKALGRAASDLQSKFGESLSSLQQFDAPIEEVTTSSLQALQAYAQGGRASDRKGNLAGIPFYQRAIELDPNFASAYATLAVRQANLGRSELARNACEKAFALRDHVSERERFRISALYYDIVSGDRELAIQTYRQWAQSYPLHVTAHGNLGDDLMQLGRWREADAETREALRLSPTAWVGYFELTYSNLALNQLDAAEATIKQALMREFDAPELLLPTYELAFLRGDNKEMERLSAERAGKDFGPDLLFEHSDTQAYYGRLDRARHFSRHAVESAFRAGARDAAAWFQVSGALREAEFGSRALAKEGIANALARAPRWFVKAVAALALARMGDTTRAQVMVREIEKNNVSDTLLNFYWVPTIKAAIDINKGNPTGAITALEAAEPYELGRDGSFHLGTLYPAFLRGHAYMQVHNGPAAAAEFQKFLDYRGIVLNYPLSALARIQLARAYAMSGDATKAKASYQEFLTLWKDADSDIPILKQAKAEYTELQ
jgi:tetratricopeptide (TPR) repeat protein